MERWKVSEWWDDYSQEGIQELETVFNKSIAEIKREDILKQKQSKLNAIPNEIKQERKNRNLSVASLVTRVGLATMLLGGMATSAASVAFIKEPAIMDILASVGLGSALVGMLTPFGLDMMDSKLMKDGLMDDIKNSQEARNNIKYLKNLQKELKKDMDLNNA